MTANQIEIKFMIAKLIDWNTQLGGSQAKRGLAESEFDFLQEQFLSKRHLVEKWQDQKEKEGITIRNAEIGHNIREGIQSLKQLLGKLKQQHRRLVKKKKDTPEILQRKQKIVTNCELLLKDIEERQETNGPQIKTKHVTLTDMKARLLHEIDINNEKIHGGGGSDGQLSQDVNSEEKEAIHQFKKKDEQMEVALDDIITGLKNVKHKVKNINEKQDQIVQKTKKADKKIDANTRRIKQDNDKLKDIIKKFKPNRCCLFLAFFLLLVGLIVCIIKVLI